MHYQNYSNISFERVDGVLTVTLDRPEALNATDEHLHKELSRVFADIAQDKETRAVILTGAGKAFCAGGDLKHGLSMNRGQTDAMVEEGRKIIIDILEVPQPIVAAVNGYAMGLGATLALFCDIVIASEQAVFADTHVVAGYVAGDGGAAIWPWLIGANNAKEFLMTGDRLSAAEAKELGLIRHVVPADQLMAEARKKAERLATGPRMAIEGTKLTINRLLRQAVEATLDYGLQKEKECMLVSEDCVEALSAFAEKRKPVFTGK
jgi:enoyl-CoA hydratase/carnithine racemase